MATYIYQYPNWPHFTWRRAELEVVFGEVRHLQGKIIGQMQAVGFSAKAEASLANLTLDVIKSSEIEGEKLNLAQVRSSIARKLGIDVGGLVRSTRHIDGVVDMMLDATLQHEKPMSHERLFGWHAALFPAGHSGVQKIEVGNYRTSEMQIVSGAMGRERVHYQAVPTANLPVEMDGFVNWFNASTSIDPVLKAAIAHFWFIIIHPFDDGNGRIARALTDMLLARADGLSERYYSLSSQILIERKQYYKVLQEVQHSDGDITDWLLWFLQCFKRALLTTLGQLDNIFKKLHFWNKHEKTALNERQRLVLNKLFEGFEGKLQSSKWAKMAHCSTDTALRDIKDLIEKGILRQEQAAGRSTNYELVTVN